MCSASSRFSIAIVSITPDNWTLITYMNVRGNNIDTQAIALNGFNLNYLFLTVVF